MSDWSRRPSRAAVLTRRSGSHGEPGLRWALVVLVRPIGWEARLLGGWAVGDHVRVQENDFRGRSIPDPGFSGDTGERDAALAAALDAYRADPGRSPEVLHALSAARVLVPVVAVLTEEEQPTGGLRREKSTDMALVTVQRPDGARALPAFTSLEALARWRSDARPVPVESARAALSAAAEGAVALVVDPAGPVPYVVAGRALRALAEGSVEPPLYADAAVAAYVQEVAAAAEGIGGARMEPAARADARVVLTVRRGHYPVTVVSPVASQLQSADMLRRRTFTGIDIAVEQEE